MPLPVALLQGYDSVMGKGLNTALTSGQPVTSGATTNSSYQICESMEKLMNAFEIDESVTAGLFGIARINQKFQFVQSQNVTSNCVSIAIYCHSTQGTETVINTALISGIQPPQSDQELREFYQVYGDCYLSSRTLGGEYCALYLYKTETREQQSQLVAELAAGGIFTKGSVDASFGTRLNNFNSTTKTQFTVAQSLSGISNQELPTPDKMIEFALRFPSFPLTAPVITCFRVTGYERVPGIGTHFNPIAANRNLIAGFNDKLSQVKALQNTISSIKDIYTFYGGYKGDGMLEQVEKTADTDMEAVGEMIKGYMADPIKTVVPPVIRSLDYGNPLLQFEVLETQGYGGEGGQPFDSVPDIRAYLKGKTRITALQLRTGGGASVDQLIVSYDGQQFYYGGSGGFLRNAAALDIGTTVKSVDGFIGSYQNVRMVMGLTITLSNGVKVPGYGGAGNPFSWTVPGNYFVVGFRGRAAGYLDQLKVVSASFKPARWIP